MSLARISVTVVLVFFLTAVCIVSLQLVRYRNEFVFVMVEESSSHALQALPFGWERLPGIFVDGDSKTIETQSVPSLLGASLAVHNISLSQGIEFAESLRFTALGRARLRLTEPLHVETRNLEGDPIEMIDNSARIVRGDLAITRTKRSGLVYFRYGDEVFTLGPGETWAELLALKDGSLVRIDPDNWEEEVDLCLLRGYPMTRLAVANMGLWPKSGVVTVTYGALGAGRCL